MSSSNKVNYSIRLNKAIERKIIAEGISNIKSKLDVSYCYIGFGSLWFTDFIHFHKFLNIDKMFSIERDKIIFDRASYNKPYSCIDLVHGESSTELNNILSTRSMPSITWLDYDDNIFACTSYISDVDAIINTAKNGSIMIVTMNVNNKKVREFKSADSTEWKNKTVELLRNTFGNVNVETAANNQLTDQNKFIGFVNPLFYETIQNGIYNSGNTKKCFKIFDFSYADNVEMVTQGFIIFDSGKEEDLKKIEEYKSNYFLNALPFRIAAPVLTVKEKSSIDQNLPNRDIDSFITASGKFNYDDIDYINSGTLGFPLNIDSLKSYSELYKFYPTYTEIYHS